MKLSLGDQTVKLIDRDVKAANKLLNEFLANVREKTEGQSAAFYYTLLCVMKLKADESIRALTPEALATILNAAAESDELRQKFEQEQRR